MTAASGDPGEKPDSGGLMPPIGGSAQTPTPGGREAPPIEQMPAYGGYPPPPPPGYGGDLSPGAPGHGTPGAFPQEASGGFPPPSQAQGDFGGYPPPPPGYQPQFGPGSYPPPAPGYPPPPPEYGAPYLGGYGAPTAETGTNSLAIFSLVASVVGLLCGIGSVIGIVLGAVALNQIKRTRQGGYGLAVAGIVVGVASLIISLVFMIYALN